MREYKPPFLLFQWDFYYPGGGPRDYANSYTTLEEARAAGYGSENAAISVISTAGRLETILWRHEGQDWY